MADKRFPAALNEHVAREFAASQQYIAIAVYYEAETLPNLAAHFYRQAVEERNHAMMMVKYLLDAGLQATIPGIEAPKKDFKDAVAPVALALKQERQVTKQISDLAAMARKEGDLVGEHFLHWFLREQLEEESSMSNLLTTVERAA
jgi:bacterioferritin B